MVETLEVKVQGCVARKGWVTLPAGATVGDAVRAAGGFGAHGFEPHGQISIRAPTRSDGRYELRLLLDFRRRPGDLETPLLDRDLVVVGHLIPDDDEPAAGS